MPQLHISLADNVAAVPTQQEQPPQKTVLSEIILNNNNNKNNSSDHNNRQEYCNNNAAAANVNATHNSEGVAAPTAVNGANKLNGKFYT